MGSVAAISVIGGLGGNDRESAVREFRYGICFKSSLISFGWTDGERKIDTK
jgi:hypothetical protein